MLEDVAKLMRAIEGLGQYENPYMVFREPSKGKELIPGPSKRPGQAICRFCRKSIYQWGKIRGSTKARDGVLHHLRYEHSPACALAWARGVVARNECGLVTTYRSEVAAWREEVLAARRSYWNYGEYNMVPPPREILAIFENLPAPIGSEQALAVEMFLIKFREVVHYFVSSCSHPDPKTSELLAGSAGTRPA